MEKEFLYVGHYTDADGKYILKIGTTNNLERRAKEHTRNYRRAKKHTMPKEQKFEYDWHLPLSKYNTLRYEDIATEKNGLGGRWVNLLGMIDLYVRKSLSKLSYRLERSMWCSFNGTPFLCVRRVSHFADTSITCPIFGTVPFIGQGAGLFSLALGRIRINIPLYHFFRPLSSGKLHKYLSQNLCSILSQIFSITY